MSKEENTNWETDLKAGLVKEVLAKLPKGDEVDLMKAMAEGNFHQLTSDELVAFADHFYNLGRNAQIQKGA